MKLAIISDTHDAKDIVIKIAQKLSDIGISKAIHLGDIIAPFTIKFMREYYKGDLWVIFGNNDGERPFLMQTCERFEVFIQAAPLILNLENRKIIAMHEPYAVEAIAKSGDFDVVLYGHTHELKIERIGNTIVVNPGEACGYLTGRRTFVILDLKDLSYEIIDL
ncbi:MAG: metallophosphoesterase [Candidatus Hydrothermota bacterium]|nr:MAG: metallophosphoesterase [Candidatus Hydrothermae bacterium]